MDQYNIMILDRQEALPDLQNMLEGIGFQRIDAFFDPAEALAMFLNRKYHILLADMDMPDLDGIELLTKVRTYDPMTQVIVMTGSSSLDRVLACLELGANDYVLKPFKSETYIAEVVASSLQKLERWKEAIRETVLRHFAASDAEG